MTMMTRTLCLLALAVLLTASGAASFPFGRMPATVGHEESAPLYISVNSLTSRKGLLPFNFYSIPTCKPNEKVMREEKVKENLGEILMGNRIMPSLYHVQVGTNVDCKVVCAVRYKRWEARKVKRLIDQFYRAHMFLDGLPLLEAPTTNSRRRPHLGYRLGVPEKVSETFRTLLNNHLNFTITYTTLPDYSYAITGFYVTPSSKEDACSSQADRPFFFNGNDVEASHSYSVTWVADTEGTAFTTRWDTYARTSRNTAKKGHWMTILNSIVLLLFLSFILGIVLLRTVRKDLLIYTDADMVDEANDETGWKLLRGDVFRSPSHGVYLSGIVGTGCQIVVMSFAIMLCTFAGILHPSLRGNLLTGLILFFCITSSMSGFVSGKMLKFFHKQSWKNGITAIMLVPGALSAWYIFISLINWYKHASTAIPFGTLVMVVFMLATVFLPLGVFGLSLGFRASVYEPACKVGSIPRAIPETARTKRPFYILGSGLIPFTAAFVEIVYVLGAFWQGEAFYYFGYLSAIIVIVGFICAEVAVMITYALLIEEDYNWWWGSLLSGGSCGVYFCAYSVVYLFTSLEIRQPISVFLYLLYTGGVSAVLSVFTGTIGFISAALFMNVIYSAIKAD